MQIEVTQKDISEGLPGRSLLCPVAVGIRRAVMAHSVVAHRAECWPSDTIPFLTVIAGRSQIKVRIGFEALGFDTPGAVQTFMRNFDRHEKVEPLSFDLAPFNPFIFVASAETGEESCQA